MYVEGYCFKSFGISIIFLLMFTLHMSLFHSIFDLVKTLPLPFISRTTKPGLFLIAYQVVQ